MKTHPRTPLAARALVAGVVMIGLAACQPAPAVPGNLDTRGNPGGGGPTTTTVETTQPQFVTTTTAAPTTTTTAARTTTTTTAPPAPSGWRLVGGDEFNGSSLNSSKWQPYYSNYGSSNLELECN